MKVVFFGTPPFAATVLEFLMKHQVEVLAVVTKPDKPQGRSGKPRPSAVKNLALSEYPDIPLFQPEEASALSFIETLRPFKADLFIVVAYGEIVQENLLQMPRLGCINVHASLLPKYRGAAPMQFALLNGDKETGVTIIEMVKKMDAGDIIAKKIVPISDSMNLEILEEELCRAGCEMLLQVIGEFEEGKVQKVMQDHEQATYVKKIDPAMARIDWKQPAQVLHNRIRAFSPKPGAWCQIKIGGQTKRMKILKSCVIPNRSGPPGEPLLYDKNSWVIACGQDSLQLLEIQLEGKKRLEIEVFLRGHPEPPSIQV